MARATTSRRRELELNLLAFELTERRFALACRAILLVVIVASAGAAIVCALHGHSWQTPSLVGGPGVASGSVFAFARMSFFGWTVPASGPTLSLPEPALRSSATAASGIAAQGTRPTRRPTQRIGCRSWRQTSDETAKRIDACEWRAGPSCASGSTR
jgi:hypothetical protein